MTFYGPRLWCVETYLEAAWLEYGIEGKLLLTWNYIEECLLEKIIVSKMPAQALLPSSPAHRDPIAAPPHHRFKSRNGS